MFSFFFFFHSYIACIRVRIYYVVSKLLLSQRGILENTDLTFVELIREWRVIVWFLVTVPTYTRGVLLTPGMQWARSGKPRNCHCQIIEHPRQSPPSHSSAPPNLQFRSRSGSYTGETQRRKVWGGIIFPLPFSVLGWDPGYKRLINKRKTNVLICMPQVHMGDAQGKRSNSPRWLRIQGSY